MKKMPIIPIKEVVRAVEDHLNFISALVDPQERRSFSQPMVIDTTWNILNELESHEVADNGNQAQVDGRDSFDQCRASVKRSDWDPRLFLLLDQLEKHETVDEVCTPPIDQNDIPKGNEEFFGSYAKRLSGERYLEYTHDQANLHNFHGCKMFLMDALSTLHRSLNCAEEGGLKPGEKIIRAQADATQNFDEDVRISKKTYGLMTVTGYVAKDIDEAIRINKEHLGRAIAALRSKLSHFKGREDSLSSQLEQMFVGKLDGKTLAGLVENIDAEIQKVTTDTGSVGVVKFKSDGKVGYGKVSTDRNSLQNEHNALRVIQDDGLARILAPIPIGLSLDENAGALFTWGTENKEMYNPNDLKDYRDVFNTLLFTYAQKNGLNLTALARDPVIQDVFNRAIIHSSQIVFDSINERPSVIPLEQLEKRASGDNASLQKLREYAKIYEEAVRRLSGLNLGDPVFIHGDSTPENIGRDPFLIRPLIDWANAKMGYAVQDLSNLGANNTSKYLDWYNFVMQIRGGKPLTDEGRDAVVCYDILQPFRKGSFKIAKGRIREAEKDIKKLERNARAYAEYFGTNKR